MSAGFDGGFVLFFLSFLYWGDALIFDDTYLVLKEVFFLVVCGSLVILCV